MNPLVLQFPAPKDTDGTSTQKKKKRDYATVELMVILLKEQFSVSISFVDWVRSKYHTIDTLPSIKISSCEYQDWNVVGFNSEKLMNNLYALSTEIKDHYQRTGGRVYAVLQVVSGGKYLDIVVWLKKTTGKEEVSREERVLKRKNPKQKEKAVHKVRKGNVQPSNQLLDTNLAHNDPPQPIASDTSIWKDIAQLLKCFRID